MNIILRYLKNILCSILILLLLMAATLYLSGHSYIFRAINNTYLSGFVTANINDHQVFSTREIKHQHIQPWSKSSNYNQQPLPEKLAHYLADNKAAAFLLIQNQQILSEHYFSTYHKLSKTNSFSMAKTLLMLMLGVALEEGVITSLQQKITDFLPEFNNDPYGRLATIGQLANMTSGYAWDERYYSPLSPTVELLYGFDVEQFLLTRSFSHSPGEHFYYSSASSQLLGILLTRALQRSNPKATLSDYLSQKLWQPLGMNDSGLWHLDGNQQIELVFCCINTNARNFAKLGQLMLNRGKWNSQQLISADFIDQMLQPQKNAKFGYSVHLSVNTKVDYFWFSGHLGQYIIVIPEKNLVVVKLGEFRKEANFRKHDVPLLVNAALELTH